MRWVNARSTSDTLRAAFSLKRGHHGTRTESQSRSRSLTVWAAQPGGFWCAPDHTFESSCRWLVLCQVVLAETLHDDGPKYSDDFCTNDGIVSVAMFQPRPTRQPQVPYLRYPIPSRRALQATHPEAHRNSTQPTIHLHVHISVQSTHDEQYGAIHSLSLYRAPLVVADWLSKRPLRSRISRPMHPTDQAGKLQQSGSEPEPKSGPPLISPDTIATSRSPISLARRRTLPAHRS